MWKEAFANAKVMVIKMKSCLKLIRRFIGILLLSSMLLLLLNLVLLAVITLDQASNGQPWTMAETVAKNLVKQDTGYMLPEEVTQELIKNHIWAIAIDNTTGCVLWQTDNLPESVPMSYTASDIAYLTRSYIDGYPTFTGASDTGLVVLGYPKESFWKHMYPSWDYQFIANLPKTVLMILFVNIALIFLIYAAVNTTLLKSIKPIIGGIQALSAKEAVHIKEKGLLSELAESINKTSELLQSQQKQLYKREKARANWIAGVSHDIRTPLSMVMGYAGQLEGDLHLSEDNRRKASVIVKQSERMRNLICDLNLASKLEYNMQPIHMEKQNIIRVVRQAAVDFINTTLDEKYVITWETDAVLNSCQVLMDKALVYRAVSNLIQNSMNHNTKGCRIWICVTARENDCTVVVADDGIGATDALLESLNHAPHYMMSDAETAEQRHGLGLLIVKQIVFAHHGNMIIKRSTQNGFEVDMTFPIA